MDSHIVKSKIELKRIELAECVRSNGISSIKTLEISQELDILINKYLLPKYKTYLTASRK